MTKAREIPGPLSSECRKMKKAERLPSPPSLIQARVQLARRLAWANMGEVSVRA